MHLVACRSVRNRPGAHLLDCRAYRGVKKESSDWDAYSRSKLFDLMAAQELNRRLYGLRSCPLSLLSNQIVRCIPSAV